MRQNCGDLEKSISPGQISAFDRNKGVNVACFTFQVFHDTGGVSVRGDEAAVSVFGSARRHFGPFFFGEFAICCTAGVIEQWRVVGPVEQTPVIKFSEFVDGSGKFGG